MNKFVRRSVLMATVFGTGVIGITGVVHAQTQSDPPARVGRLAFAEGTVSFHDAQDANWTPAAVNESLTSGDSLWTEPNARSEVSIAGTRVRLDQSTQLDMLQIDDSQTRLQLDQGRLDIKTFTMDTSQPYEIVTPRGTVKLEAQGDYYIESGSTEDPTRLGVRSGAAQITGLNGQVLAVRAGEVGEISGDAATPQLHTIKSAPPPVPTYWAQRDRQINYDQPQYVSADVVGYEDLQAYGSWTNDSEYGQVWSPRNVSGDWQPYYTGRWAYSQPYGWTWVDEQPWGYAPYHYGRWAHRDNRWFWVPPERQARPVYAPALVAFVGGVELGMTLGNASAAPVGWFPLGPREAYVPPYTHDRGYYDRINQNARVERAILDDRWNRAERHEAIRADEQNERMANRRFATVVPASAFTSEQRVNRVALKVSADKIATAPVAAVSAPPTPTQSIAAPRADDPKAKEQAELRAKAEADAKAHGNVATANTHFNGVQELARPPQAQRAEQRTAPGPKIAATVPTQSNAQAPTAQAPAVKPTGLPPLEPRRGAAPPTIQGERTQAPQPNVAKPGEAPRPPQAQQRPGENGHPPVPPAPNKVEGTKAEPNKVEAPKPPQAPQAQHSEPQRPEPQRPEAQRPAENRVAPQPPHQAEPPRAPQAQPQPQPGQPEPQRPAENHVTPPAAPSHQAEAPRPATAAPPQAQPQHVQAPSPQVAAPQPQHVQAPPPAAPPQVQHAPAPPPQVAAPHPAPPAAPPQQAQVPHPAPPAPAPAPAKEEKKEEKK